MSGRILFADGETAIIGLDQAVRIDAAGSVGGPAALAGSLLQFGRALKWADNAVLVRDTAVVCRHGDRKALRRKRERKSASVYKADVHKNMRNKQTV